MAPLPRPGLRITSIDPSRSSTDGSLNRLVRRYGRFGRFVAVGCVNAVVSYSVFSVALLTTHAANLSVVITWCVGIAFNFFSTGRFVFGNKDFRRLIPFVLSYAVSMIVNIVLINVLIAWGFGGLIAQALSLPGIVLFSYFLNAKLVFRPGSSPYRGTGTPDAT